MNQAFDGQRPMILVVNQHGDNRGDEAAMRAMLSGLARRLPGARFTVLHQFDNPSLSCVSTPQEVSYLPLRLPLVEGVRLLAASLLLWLRIPARRLAGRIGRQILDAYGIADIVISAPGGPYFGDLYADHEVVHWFFVWLGRVRGLPLALYAPSVGPFEKRWLNPLRRRGFRWFDVLTLREERSAQLLRELQPDISLVVTADAALQEDPTRFRAGDHDGESRSESLIVAAFKDPGASQPLHDDAIVEAFRAVATEVPMRLMLLPQVHGRHRDRPYLEALAGRLADVAVPTVVADERTTSDEQRALVANADVVVAGRYHPAVFAAAAGVPVLVIPYEHKAHGLADAARIESWVIDIADVTPDRLREALLRLYACRGDVGWTLAESSRDLRERAAKTSELVAELVCKTRRLTR